MRDDIQLRDIEPTDLPIFYEHQLDADAGARGKPRAWKIVADHRTIVVPGDGQR